MTTDPGSLPVDDPLWFRDAIIYELHVRAFADSNGDGIGDFPGLVDAPRLPARPRRHGALAAAVLSLAAARRRLRHRRLPHGQPDLRQPRRLPPLPRRRPRARPARHHRAGHQPHLRPAPVVPARPPGRAGQRGARLLRVERHARALPRHPHHLPGLRDLELDVGSGGQRVLLAPLLPPPAGPQLRQPGGQAGGVRRARLLDGHGRRRAAPRRGPVPVRARGHQLREPARDARVPARAAPPHRPQVHRAHAAGRGQPVAGGRGRLLRAGRRVPHELPLPAHAAPVHGAAAGAGASRSSTSWSRRRPSRTTASGRCSCATTTSSPSRW